MEIICPDCGEKFEAKRPAQVRCQKCKERRATIRIESAKIFRDFRDTKLYKEG